MDFIKHSDLKGAHAFLSASSYHWLNYSDARLIDVYNNLQAKERGTKLHEFAEQAIRLGVKLPKTKKTLNMYVNDAIGFHMHPEQVLFYSYNCFGTADTISFRDDFLRIHDLKTGSTPAKMDQLYIYAALFCLEYSVDPNDITIETRIYQNDQAVVDRPNGDLIKSIMNLIIHFDKLIEENKREE